MFRLFFPFVFLSLIFSATASAGISTAPAREAWALSTTDAISVNYLTKTANASVYLNAVDGTLYRATATTTSARLLGVAETALSGGKGNLWLTAAIAAAGLSYEAYQWYRSSDGSVAFGYCQMSPSALVTRGDCTKAMIDYYKKLYPNYSGYSYGVTTTVTNDFTFLKYTDTNELHDTNITIQNTSLISHTPGTSETVKYTYDSSWYFRENRNVSGKNPVSDDVAASVILGLLVNADSSRQAFGENNQPYPLDGLFTNEDLAVDPTYSPSADLNTETLPDYITKYNNGLLQTVDPSKPNYVTPAQYAYIKAQAEQAAAIAVNPNTNTSGATNTNPLLDMDQPITQAQYDESNKKTDDSAKSAVNAQSFDGFGDKKTLDDGNNKLKEISEGGILALSPFVLPSLPTASACQSVAWEFMGQSVEIPGADGCKRLADLKRIFGYLLYVLTAIAIIWKATEKPLE
jgi:hypothetical protein